METPAEDEQDELLRDEADRPHDEQGKASPPELELETAAEGEEASRPEGEEEEASASESSLPTLPAGLSVRSDSMPQTPQPLPDLEETPLPELEATSLLMWAFNRSASEQRKMRKTLNFA